MESEPAVPSSSALLEDGKERQSGQSAAVTDANLEAYKLLCDQLKHDESMFWTRFQSYLFVSSGLAALLVGLLGLVSRAQPAGQYSDFPISLIYLSAVSVCVIAFMITAAWVLLGARAEAICDHWVEQLKHLEKIAFPDIAIFTALHTTVQSDGSPRP
jgi:hypothetical protein